MTLDERDLERLSGINEELSMTEVEDIYLPMSRHLWLQDIMHLAQPSAWLLAAFSASPDVPMRASSTASTSSNDT